MTIEQLKATWEYLKEDEKPYSQTEYFARRHMDKLLAVAEAAYNQTENDGLSNFRAVQKALDDLLEEK